MELTIGELLVIVDTLAESLHIANWAGYSAENREAIFQRILNDQELKVKLEMVEEEGK